MAAAAEGEAAENIELRITDCIFCPHASETLEDNLRHMFRHHGFFVPDIEFVVDLVGLIAYLQNKVSEYHMCLLCNGTGRQFYSMEAARGHMVDKGHCFVEYEEQGQMELEEFYDFSSSYPDYDPEAEAKEAAAKAAKAAAAATSEGGGPAEVEMEVVEGEGGDDDAGEWEDVDEDEDEDDESSAAPDAMKIQKYTANMHSLALAPEHKVTDEGYQMVLPSGKTIGHRSMQKYHKQRFGNVDTRDSVVIQSMMTEYKALELQGAANGAVTKEMRDIRDRQLKAEVKHIQTIDRGMGQTRATWGNRFFRQRDVVW